MLKTSMRCLKKTYRSTETALYALQQIRKKGKGKKPIRIYKCDLCLKYHLTSKEKKNG